MEKVKIELSAGWKSKIKSIQSSRTKWSICLMHSHSRVAVEGRKKDDSGLIPERYYKLRNNKR